MIYVILGATGVGKTKTSIEMAKKYNAEIINADAFQIYQSMDIGTAKITEVEKNGVIHHMFDICKPDEEYNVMKYQLAARKVLNKLLQQNKNIIICGGTGLYIKSLLYDYRFYEEKIRYDYESQSLEELQKLLPETTDIDISNKRRVIRYLQKRDNQINIVEPKKLYNFKSILLDRDRTILYQRINNRVDKMIHNGLVEEVKLLISKYPKSKALHTAIGYKEIIEYLENKCSLEEAIENIKLHTRRYAKRQLTFFRNQFEVDEIIHFNN